MTNERKMAIVFACGMAFIALVGLGLLGAGQNAVAAPPSAPTPVITNYSADVSKPNVAFLTSRVITNDVGGTDFTLADYEAIDLQWVIDQTAVNTLTLKLQHSNDGINWVDGATVVSGNTADVNAMQQFNLFGWKTRVYADVTNSNPVTITVIGVAK